MLLTGSEILDQVHQKRIVIEPFKKQHLSTNSYDVTLSNQLMVYDLHQQGMLDLKKVNPTKQLEIPEDGLILQPNCLYLGATNETAVSSHFVPMYEGRSSMGRLGVFSHVTAGFGDIGWGFIMNQHTHQLECTYPTWTLEIVVVHPIRIYPNIRIGQVYFFLPHGTIELYKGKYHIQKLPQPSRMWEDFKTE